MIKNKVKFSLEPHRYWGLDELVETWKCGHGSSEYDTKNSEAETSEATYCKEYWL